jgi:hypothetical protein
MGDLNQLDFVTRHRGEFTGPFLEIGSKNYGTTQDLRAMFPDEEYTGVDLEPGEGVDLVLDLTDDCGEIDRALGGTRYGTIFCLSVLEHCEQPFLMAEHLTALLDPGGKLVISAPFSWHYHAYPDDYWRFTPEGIAKLFPALTFDHPGNCLTTGVKGDVRPLDKELGRIKLRGSHARAAGRWWRGLFLDLLGILPPWFWLTRHRNLQPNCLVNVIGTRPLAEQKDIPAG